MPLLRISEPFFYNVIKRNIVTMTRKLFCRPPPPKPEQSIPGNTLTSETDFDKMS